LVYLSNFGIFDQEKSGKPGADEREAAAIALTSLTHF
jgi:hypothetical protein